MFLYVFFSNINYVPWSYFLLQSKLNVFVLCYYIVTFNFFLHTRSLLIPCTYVSIDYVIKSIDCIILSSFELKAILLISSVKALCLSLPNLCCVFNISLLFSMNSF